jgi:hypothetical protein
MILLFLAAAVTYPPGDASCGTWTSIHRSKTDIEWFLQEGWLSGFISGVNKLTDNAGGDILHGSDRRGASEWVSKYCEEHPLDTISKAAWEMLRAARQPSE